MAADVLVMFLLLIWTDTVVGLKCHCEGRHCPEDHKNSTCNTAYKCFAIQLFVEGTLEKIREYGCIALVGGEFVCRTPNLVRHYEPNTVECCDNYDFCNYELEPTIQPAHEKEHQEKFKTKQEDSSNKSSNLALMITTTLCISLLIILISYFFLRYRQIVAKQRLDSERQFFITNGTAPTTISELYTTSGAGIPILTVRSIARDITVYEEIGRGRFSVVCKGRWMHQFVAVKTVLPCDEISLTRELDMYKSGNINHENILNFIAADIINDGNSDGNVLRWIITSYQPYGSLYDFLQTHTYDHRILFRLVYSTVCGLHYIHRLISGIHGKPAIAHRDIKSKNIYVKEDLQCCIGDLGLAVKFDPDTNELNFNTSQKLPTIRYMAPEILEADDFSLTLSVYQKSDIYSFGLVLWEILRRYEVENAEEMEHQLPYHEFVNENPSKEEMRKVVLVQKERPRLPSYIEEDVHGVTLVKIMRECWYKESSPRLTALRIKKTLTQYVQNQDLIEVSGGSNSCNTASTGLS